MLNTKSANSFIVFVAAHPTSPVFANSRCWKGTVRNTGRLWRLDQLGNVFSGVYGRYIYVCVHGCNKL